MGILRTDTISGLETPTPVTGSVSFDGSGDYLSLASSGDFAWGTGDFTWETWVYSTASDHTTGNHYIFDLGGGNIAAMSFYQNKFNYYNTTIGLNGQLGTFSANRWTHLAVSRKNQVSYIFVDGILQGSISDTHNYGTTALVAKVGVYAANNTLGWEGHISNLRILKGTALYTSNFTPPTRELQPIGDTVLLCCNNPDSAGAEATGKTITVNGDAVASTFSPGLTRDFTYGTQFDGVSRFDTQGYFVPPSGTTEQRSRGRGVFGGGYTSVGVNILDYVNIQSQGNAIDFGDLNNSVDTPSPCSSSTRGLFAGGSTVFSPANAINNIDYITISTTGNAVDFGDLRESRRFASGGVSNNTRGVWGGGYTPTLTLQMDYVTIASTGNALDFGTTVPNPFFIQGLSSPTRGVWGGGYAGGQTSIIRFITIATTGTISSFGNLTVARHAGTAASSSIRGLFAGGRNGPDLQNVIDYITIASTGNAQDFGDLISARRRVGACSNSTRGLFGGGYNPNFNLIDFVNIASTGDAVDFGDLTSARRTLSGLSDSHGGLS
jgi:hypothetical protein